MHTERPRNVAFELERFLGRLREVEGDTLATVAVVQIWERSSIGEVNPEREFARAVQIVAKLAGMFDKLDEELSFCAPKRLPHYREYLEPLKTAVCMVHPEIDVSQYRSRMDWNSIRMLNAAGTELAERPRVEQQFLHDLQLAIYELRRRIEEAVTDPHLNRWLQSLCRQMQSAIDDYKIHGAESFSEAYAKMVGELAVRGDHFKDRFEQVSQPVRSAFANAWAKFETVVKATDTTVKAIALGAAVTIYLVGTQPLKALPAPQPPAATQLVEEKTGHEEVSG